MVKPVKRTFPVLALIFALALALVSPAVSYNELQAELSPSWVNSLSEKEYFLNLENLPTSPDGVNELRIPKPVYAETKIVCGAAPAGWDLASPFGNAICAYATSEKPIAPGEKVQIPLKLTFASLSLNITLIAKDTGTENTQNTFILKVNFDNTTPSEIRVSAPIKNSWERQGRGVYFDASAEDLESGISSCRVYLGSLLLGSLNYTRGDSEGKCAGIVYLPEKMAEGVHQLSLVQADFAGNTQSAEVGLTIDNTPPKISGAKLRDVGGSLSGGFVKPGANFELVASIKDFGSGFAASTVEADISKLTGVDTEISVRPDSCDESSCTWTGAVKNSARDGEKLTYVVFASDKAGSGIGYFDDSVVVDAEKPSIVIEGAGIEEISSKSKMPIRFSVTDAPGGSGISTGEIIFLVNGEKTPLEYTKDANCVANLDLPDGKHIVRITAPDGVGNPGESYEKEIVVDTLGPKVGKVDLKYRLLSAPLGVVIEATISDASTDVKSAKAVIDGREIALARDGAVWRGIFSPDKDLGKVSSVEILAVDFANNPSSEKVEHNLFQLVVVGLLSHIFFLVLGSAIIYWMYGATIKKKAVVGHFESYKPETFGEKAEKFWFDLRKGFGKGGKKQHSSGHRHSGHEKEGSERANAHPEKTDSPKRPDWDQ